MGSKVDAKSDLPRSCADHALRYLCSFLFRPCSSDNVGINVFQFLKLFMHFSVFFVFLFCVLICVNINTLL